MRNQVRPVPQNPRRPWKAGVLPLAFAWGWVLACALALFPVVVTAQGGAAAPVPQVTVRVLPQSEVPGAEYTLGEVAELEGADLALVRRLAGLSLGRSPLPGRSQRLSESYIQARLGREASGVEIAVTVPSGAEVVRASQVVAGEDVAARVLAFAADEATAAGLEVEQEMALDIPDVVLPKGDVTWEIDAQGRRLSAGGARTYRVAAKVNGEEAWRTMARVDQKVYRTVVVAVRSVRRNQVVGPRDVTVARKSVVGVREEAYLTRLEEVVGARAKRPIGRGEWVHKGLLVARADVAEGGPVTLVYQTPKLRFSTPGVAMVPGKVGEFIPVRNLQSGRIVYGVVQNDETVKVN